ncbi:hypothetical protein [Microbacterium immunditiarum]|uniref:Uncharacterized protein n=1 Tax=Microbacterium immunditiarum TaxID=337480 RepID=A0A7Y9GNI8_9MICO|nr:hypothetical protein [Microbacterium immunditiarum]NYE19679.1 hypothetical protein [Microbacterium immunditiarum]
MLPVDIPDRDQLISLTEHRDAASVSISLASSPVPQDHERIRIALRDAIDDAARQLEKLDLPHGARHDVVGRLRSVIGDDEFWTRQSRSIVLLAAPGVLHAFRVANRLTDRVVVSDRFDVSGLIRAGSFPLRGFVLKLSQQGATLAELDDEGRLAEHPISLPDDHRLMLERTTTDGTFDRRRAHGATGDRVERERFCRVVQDEVVKVLPRGVPLILVASDDLDPAYSAVNTHDCLLDDVVHEHPDSLTRERLEHIAREILERRRTADLREWRERFGNLRAQGLATTRLRDVAVAAASDAIDELRFDLDADVHGRVDEYGKVEPAGVGGREGYDVVDELVTRVLRAGGKVRAIRKEESIDGSPVAATLRFPVPARH